MYYYKTNENMPPKEGYEFRNIDGVLISSKELPDLEAVEYEEVSEILENSHFNKELNQQITKIIREKYSIDDEIALIKKGGQAYDEYQAYCQSAVNEIKQFKIKVGLKEG